MQTVTLTCETGHATDALWFGYCLCGGDRASDDDLARPPSVWLSISSSSAGSGMT